MSGAAQLTDDASPEPGSIIETVVEGRDLVRAYRSESGERRALDGVSIDVRQGRMLAVMGPSGSGKSTLLHLLGGLDRPTSGEVVIAGQSLASLSDRDLTVVRRRQVGVVFQTFNPVPVLTGEENLAHPLGLGGRRG